MQQRATIQFTVRLPEELVTWLEDKAKSNRRSRHNELVHTLDKARKKEVSENK